MTLGISLRALTVTGDREMLVLDSRQPCRPELPYDYIGDPFFTCYASR